MQEYSQFSNWDVFDAKNAGVPFGSNRNMSLFLKNSARCTVLRDNMTLLIQITM